MTGLLARRRGFTLMELLLTMSLATVILVETAMIYRIATQAYRQSDEQAAGAGSIDDALRLIREDVTHLACPTDPRRPSLAAAGNIAAEDAALLRLRTVGAGVVDYFVYVDGQGRRKLIRRSEPIRDGTIADRAPVAWEVLADRVVRFDLRFFDGSAWIDRWTAMPDAAVPKLMEVTLTLRTPGGREITRARVLPIVVGPPLAVEGGEL